MEDIQKIQQRLPAYDCGSCGSPTCAAFAEDIVRGYSKELDCVYVLKDRLHEMARQMADLSDGSPD